MASQGHAKYYLYSYLDENECPKYFVYAGGNLERLKKLYAACLIMTKRLNERIVMQGAGIEKQSHAFVIGKPDETVLNGFHAGQEMKNPGAEIHNQHTPVDTDGTDSNRPK